MTRSVPEWIGKTDDTKVPDHVKLRVFEAHGGICHISKRKIAAGEPWDVDHVIALCNGGENRESNLAPALRDKHREKTAADVKQKSDDRRRRSKQLGIKTAKSVIPGSRQSRFKKKLDGTVVLRD